MLFFSILISSFAYSLEIYRPSNFGLMDEIPCILKITDMDGNDASDKIISISVTWYDGMQTDPHWTHKYYDGCFTGGAIVHLEMQRGTYKISVSTPKEHQRDYLPGNTEEWTSNEFTYKTGSPALKVIFISPTANQNGFYTGGWHIDYRAPKYFMYTKPYRE
ncbi:MAG: hypothetical protein II563_02775 [Treponema sp.]|nr:hypothetical protein [Treponema sp.]